MSDAPPRRAVLEVWCELQCPNCRAALGDIHALRSRYGDRLTVELRHFPLDKHRYSTTAAQAAEEAIAQGKGWPYIEAMLGRAEELAERGDRVLIETAQDLGLDATELDTALVDGRHFLIVDADLAEGKAIGVTGTPTYVIDGVVIGGDEHGMRERIEEIADLLLADR
jgi:protein-disulfide isomerase